MEVVGVVDSRRSRHILGCRQVALKDHLYRAGLTCRATGLPCRAIGRPVAVVVLSILVIRRRGRRCLRADKVVVPSIRVIHRRGRRCRVVGGRLCSHLRIFLKVVV